MSAFARFIPVTIVFAAASLGVFSGCGGRCDESSCRIACLGANPPSRGFCGADGVCRCEGDDLPDASIPDSRDADGRDDADAADEGGPADDSVVLDDATSRDDATDSDTHPPDLCEDPPTGPSAFGTPCFEDTDCDPGFTCWTEYADMLDGEAYVSWAGGYCAPWGWEDSACDADVPGSCGPGGVCAYLGTEAGLPDGPRAYACLDACDPLTDDGRPHADNCDCREGYECLLATGVCWPGCSNDRECCEIWRDGDGGPEDGARQASEVVFLPPGVCSNRCDTMTYRCINEGCHSGSCAIGDPCNHDTDCPAGVWCRVFDGEGDADPRGVCTLDACSAPGRECPAGAVCADLQMATPLAGFSCVASCTLRVPPTASGCPDGLACHELLDPTGTIVGGCLPPCDPAASLWCEPEVVCDPVSSGCIALSMTPDFDGDTISNDDEARLDTDGDTVADFMDLDSDSDGIPDADEAGDADLATPPDDCDGDTLPNFRDVDSDDDCLRDYDEVFYYFTDPYLADTDGDGVDDLIETTYGSNPLDPTDDPRTRGGDIIFLMPYLGDPRPAEDVMVFSTSLQLADVYFLLDVSATMVEELAALRASMASTIIPGIVAAIPDTWFGLGHFSDYPLAPYGAAGDEAYVDDRPITTAVREIPAELEVLAIQDGGDEPDSQVPALQAVATGAIDRICPRPAFPSCTAGGHPCFRDGAVPLVVLITDSSFHSGPGETDPYGMIDTGTCSAFRAGYEDARSALVAGGIKVLGVEAGGSSTARADLEQLATDTGAMTSAGPIVRDVPSTGAGLGSAIIEAVQAFAFDVPERVELVAIDDPSDAADAVASFIDTIEPEPSGSTVWDPATATTRVCTVLPTADGDGDTIADSYPSLLPGTSVCFHIRVRRNETVPDDWDAHIFRVTLEVRTDRDVPLDSRDIFFMVPPCFCGSGCFWN